MRAYALDSSALLSIVFDETGADKVAPILAASVISAVNLTEVVATLSDRGVPEDEVSVLMAKLCPEVIVFDPQQAWLAGKMRRQTRSKGLSLGDRACLALGKLQGRVAITADRAWAELDLDVEIEMIR